MIKLRQYQQDIINKVRSEMDKYKSILIQSPTGSGKTATTAEMLRLASLKGKRSWFIVHRRELVKQSVLAFHNIGLKVGVVASGFPEAKGMPIQVCSIQTLIRRHTKLKKPDFIVWDECAHIAAKSWASLYKIYGDVYHVGLTATPWRLDGSGLENFFKTMVCGPSVSWLIKNGFLSNYRLYAPSSIDTKGVHTRMGDFVKSELSMVADKPSITGDVIKHYKRLCFGKRAVVFCVSVEHSKHVVSQFIAEGIPAEHVDGETDQIQRDNAIKRFAKGESLILSNVELFGEGFDLPSIEAVIMLRPTASLGLHLQQIGRGLRVHEGKETALILDHAGNTMRHGLPDDDRQWSLKGLEQNNKTTTEKGISVRVCTKCFAAQRPNELKCRFCGFVFDIKYRKVDQVDGELTEIDIAKIRKTRLVEQSKAETFEQLVELGKKRGYKRPYLWAKFVLKARKNRR
jgi:superfamily II DNA or RNA helicase